MHPEHTYMDVVKFRKENLHRYWCNYSSHGVAGDDPGSARHRIALGDVVIVENQPRFKIHKGATIYTIGSCFARNVERSLKRQGFRVPTAEIEIDKDIYIGHTVFHNTVLNKYNAHSMATEILRGLEASPDPGLVEVDPGQWYDPQTSYTRLMALEEVSALRNKLDELARNVANSDLVVMTLGLTETWFDTSSKVAFNGLNVVAIKHRRATTAFFNATVAQVFEVLADALEKLIGRNPEVKVVVTVSPVPMAQTFTNLDVFTANTYSKAVLRVAAQMLTARFPFVDYFPSYEMVMNSPRAMTWADDQVHVAPPVVEQVISAFASRYIDV
ncbi:GSCFA domain-containing protein [Luteimonas soli]|uniref:GSCFA domain-containing protein n=2 Tax=Luteimonas soli TaxID=1648966 RepID=A0ABV7XF90_9GAMM